MRKININTLPENYTPEWWEHHLRSWPQLTLVAEQAPAEADAKPQIVGYALGHVQVCVPRRSVILFGSAACGYACCACTVEHLFRYLCSELRTAFGHAA